MELYDYEYRAIHELGAYIHWTQQTDADIKADDCPIINTALYALEHYAEYLRLLDKMKAKQIEYNMKQIWKQANEHAKTLKGGLQ